MRISVSRDLKSRDGYSNFMRRLLEHLKKQGKVKVVRRGERSDVHIIIISGPRKKGSLNIARIDGAYYDHPRVRGNVSIGRTIQIADAVVFQSDFSRKHVLSLTRSSPKRSAVIFNGISINQIKRIPKSNIDLSRFDKVFVACSRWKARPAKRLEAVIRGFQIAKKKSEMSLGLVVIGEIKRKPQVTDRSITWLGKIRPRDVISTYKACDYMVHISHIDSCPNSVIEALCCGLPVLCNNLGGTPEIVGQDGIVVPIDDSNYKLGKVFRSLQEVGPKSVDNRKLAHGFLDMSLDTWEVHRPDLDISCCASRYYSLFTELLGT